MNLYQALDVAPTATPEEIKRSFKKLAMKHHPDRESGDKEQFQAVQKAYEVLSDPERRARYDETGETSNGPTLRAESLAALAELLCVCADSGMNFSRSSPIDFILAKPSLMSTSKW